MTNTCCFLPWAGLFPAHLHFSSFWETLLLFCSFSTQSWTLLLHLGVDLKLVWMQSSAAADNSLFAPCRHSVGAFPSPVKCLEAHQYLFIQECSSTGHLSCLPWPGSGIYSMAGQGTARGMSRSFSCLEDSPSLGRRARFVLDQHRSLTVPQIPQRAGPDPSGAWPQTLTVCPEVSFNTWAKMLKGPKISLS